ncbi:MAG: hypothetical protein WBL21_04680 [Salinimicrobium sp.]
MKPFFIHLLLPGLFSFQLHSQTVEPSSTVGRSQIQTELATSFSQLDVNGTTTQSWAPGTLFRYGVSNMVELQLNFQAIQEKLVEVDKPVFSEVSFQNPEVGLAIHLWEEKGIIPEASIMTRIGIPYERPFSPSGLEGILALNLSQAVYNNLVFNYNVGFLYIERFVESVFLVSNLSFEPVSKFHFFIENVVDKNRQGDLSGSLAAGGGYNFSESVILDLSAGNNLHDPGLFAGLILTWCYQL